MMSAASFTRRTAFTMLVASLFAATAAGAAERLTIRLDFIPVGFHGAMHLAKEKGWFQREGLDVDIQDGTGSINTLQLVASGQVDVGQVQLGVMAIAKEKGLPLKSFAGFVRKGDLGVVVPRDSKENKVSDLRGKKLVCFTASPWAPFIDSFLAKGGLDRSSVDISMVPPASMAAIYGAGAADGMLTVIPFGVPIMEKTRPSKAILLADYGINFPSYGLVATEKTLAERRNALARLVKVQVETWAYIWSGHEDEAVDAIIKARPTVKLDAGVLRQQLELNRNLFNTPATEGKPIGWQSSEDWDAALNTLRATGVVESKLKPEDYYTNDLLPGR
jgi:NitT/TauT family transport system substrate-binding protein